MALGWARQNTISTLMDRELPMETMGKRLVPTNKIKVMDNLDDTGVSI